MTHKIALAAAALLAISSSIASFARAGNPPLLAAPQIQQSPLPDLRQAATDALDNDPAKASAAIKILRAADYAGLDEMLAVNSALLTNRDFAGQIDAQTARARAALDQIAMQKDATESRLYWYTDINAALAQAAATGKPILTLRMLGNLNEDLSCANSRFFRTTLYPNKNVQTYLRDNFILHWESVRPVPIITIDMGDGRKIVRTMTGNSIHYVLDAKGRLVDAIPGLYGPAAFLRALTLAHDQAQAMSKMNDHAWANALAQFQTTQAQTIQQAFATDMKTIGIASPTALTDDAWKKIADLHADDAILDAGAREAMRGKIPAEVAMRATMSKMAVEDPLMKVVRNVQGLIGIDTVKNEYLFHQTICQWLSKAPPHGAMLDLPLLNDRVYAELFLTPRSDPWLGLAPADVYSGIDNGGLVEMARQ